MSSLIICAVCGKESRDHGDGMKVPITTCIECYEKRIKENKKDKEIERFKERQRKIDEFNTKSTKMKKRKR